MCGGADFGPRVRTGDLPEKGIVAGKLMGLLKALSGCPRDRFVARCEAAYPPLVAKVLPSLREHRRHYVTGRRSSALVAAGQPFLEDGFDLVAEFRLPEGSEAEEVAVLNAAYGVVEAAGVFDPAACSWFRVDEARSTPVLLASRPPEVAEAPAIRTFVLIQKTEAWSRDRFVHHYETIHVPTVLTHLAHDNVPLFATYIRNYPRPSPAIFPAYGHGQKYDVLCEICYWREADAELFGPCMAPDGAVAAFSREAVMMRPGGFAVAQVDTRGDRDETANRLMDAS